VTGKDAAKSTVDAKPDDSCAIHKKLVCKIMQCHHQSLFLITALSADCDYSNILKIPNFFKPFSKLVVTQSQGVLAYIGCT